MGTAPRAAGMLHGPREGHFGIVFSRPRGAYVSATSVSAVVPQD